jgi:NDP-hexose 4-ketoreductase
MRLLVIGGSGFLGRHVTDRAREAGHEVITASRSPRPGSHLQLDLAAHDAAMIAGLIAGHAPDAVVNCAGATTGPAQVMAGANITGSYALARAMIEARLPARLVHLGSAAEYGRTDPGAPVAESVPPQPVGMYGATKLAATRLLELARSAGLPAVVLRVFNPVGARAPASCLPGAVAAGLRQAAATGCDVQLGSLDAVRDFVDARDVADAVLATAGAAALPPPVINIGSGTGVPARALVKELLAISGSSAVIREDAAGSQRSAATSWQQADISTARRELGWRPRRSLTDSLCDLWEATSDEDLR